MSEQFFAALKRRFRRAPDFIIGDPFDAYMRRWWIIPRNRWFNIYLHNIRRDDDDRALHDHPWWNVSVPLRGCIEEVMPLRTRVMKPRRIYIRRPQSAHRLVVGSPRGHGAAPADCWTIFITGPRVREWGFHCPKGWRHWKDFTAPGDPGRVGRGCDD